MPWCKCIPHRPCTNTDCELLRLQVERQLLVEEPLPWEGDRLTSAIERRLGAIKTPVLRMLCRDPVQRASCKELATTLRAVFSDATTTVEHAA